MKKFNKQFLSDIIKTVLIALIFSAIFILGLSLLIGFVPVSNKVIVAVNQGIKALSLLFSCLLCFKDKSKGLLKGVIVGLLYALISWLLFGTVQDALSFSVSTLIDIALGVVMGAISGSAAVIFSRKQIAE